jgi:CheY-like chemotaxis protein
LRWARAGRIKNSGRRGETTKTAGDSERQSNADAAGEALPVAAIFSLIRGRDFGRLAYRGKKSTVPTMARFLVIDDDNTMRGLIVATLKHAGHGVDQATSGGEARAIFRQRPADVVITDIVMPNDSLVQVIAFRNEFPGVPFIVASGLAMNSPQAPEIAQLLGARRWLAKPFNLAELRRVADEVAAEQTRRASVDRPTAEIPRQT